MKNIRIGKDIVVRWTILTNGEAQALDARDLRLECHAPGHTISEIEFTASGNVAEFTIRGIDMHRVGRYSFTMWENYGKNGQSAVDCCDAFNLVYTTCEEGGDDPDGLETTTVDLGTSDLQISESGVLQRTFRIQTKKKNSIDNRFDDLYTVIEGVTDEDLKCLSDSDQYRICLLRFRKHQKEGPRWRIPMLPYELAKRTGGNVQSEIAETDTWWPITGRIVPWFRNRRKLSEAVQLNVSENKPRFCATRTNQVRIGTAIFKYTGRGGEGWTRVSNISYVSLFLNHWEQGKGGSISVKMNG